MALLPSDPKERKLYLLGLRIAGDFGAVIAAPVVILVLVAQKIDSYYNIKPWGTVVAFLLSAFISGSVIYKKAKAYGRTYTSLIVEEKKNDKEDKNV